MSQLTPEDRDRVQRYLNSPTNAGERKPFRVWLLLGIIWGVMVLFGLASYLIAWRVGVV
ncbi:DUF3094 family protein [Exilibacterium tricleocarpae]|uniref:DUF3094 family protein n=1 Tax=Exilibacterium tricleocarpae TaxID=2591008 RepID=A0A545T3N6_9GAMM|nr:DUF3094 family protein [Exilibacterium tricleocarpae]TQV71829.1 DUF3094 family protein [Exilibacterium tricleocarpae]